MDAGTFISDAIRNITARVDVRGLLNSLQLLDVTSGAFLARVITSSSVVNASITGSAINTNRLEFEASRVVPTAHENRGASISVCAYLSY